MTVLNGVAHGTDTDFISLVVEGPNDQHFSRTYGPNNLHRNDTTDWALSSTPISVPQDALSVLKISWAAVNRGNTAGEQIAAALVEATTEIGREAPNPLVVIASTLVDFGLRLVLANCDAPLFGQTVSFTGSELAAGLNGNGWSSESPNKWRAVFDYPNIHSNCDTGHYNLEVHVKRQAPTAITQISAGSANNVWGVNAAGEIYRYNNGRFSPIKIPIRSTSSKLTTSNRRS